MTDLPSRNPNPPPMFAARVERRSLWKPLFISLASSAALAFITCAGGISLSKGSGVLGSLLLYAGLFFLGVFGITILAMGIYFFIWLGRR